jgi:hypothetical protein
VREKTRAVVKGIEQGHLAADTVRRMAAEAERKGIPLHKLIPVR